MAKKKEPGFWSTSANGKTSSGGSWGVPSKAQQRSNHGRKSKDSCVVVLVIGASLLAGLSFFITEAARWLA